MDVEITELEKIDATRVDGVGVPANGIPILLMKAVAKGQRDCPGCERSYDADHQGSTCENCGARLPDAQASKADGGKVDCPTCKGDGKIMGGKRDCPDCGASGKVSPGKAKTLATKALVKAITGRKVDEAPDIAGGTAVLAQIADLIIAEAQELKSGQAGEIADIQQLACAAEMIWCWRTGEESVAAGSVMPATALMQSAAENWTPEQIRAIEAFKSMLAKDRDYSAAERKEMAGDGRALPDGSYPINDEHDLNSAAILARSGHGDVEAATRHIGKRAKELGVPNPLDGKGDTGKSAIANEGTDVDTVTKETGDLIAKAAEDAVTKAVAPLRKRVDELESSNKALNAELAKVKATPIPGGPVLTRITQPRAAAGDEQVRKAEYYESMADIVSDPGTAAEYRQLARRAREQAALTA